MKMLDIPLKAGQPWEIGRGRFVRVFDALYPVTIKTQALNGKSNQESKLIANMGAEFVPFSKADIVSEHDQIIRIAYSELHIFDNRLGVENATVMQVLSPQIKREINSYPVGETVRVQVLAASTKRKKALIATSGECVFYSSEAGGAGFKINGDFDELSNSELWVISSAGSVDVEVMEFSYL
jgi:hypothetical protein